MMGLVTASNEVSLVGTMTSAGTDVIEMSASTSRSTTGASVDVVVGDSVSSVATVVGAIDDAVETGAAVEFGCAAGGESRESHAAVRRTKATRQRIKPRNVLDLTTLSPPAHGTPASCPVARVGL